jgi:hypothetical protein
MSKFVNIAINTLGIPLGAFAIIAGEADDSPGLQGLGLLLLIYIFIRSFKQWRKLKREISR